MTTNDLINIVEAMPDIRVIDMVPANKRKAIQQLVPVALDEVVVSYDWDFATDVADETTVANQAEYTLKGNGNNCRDIINLRYGTTSDGFVLLDKMRPVDVDAFVSGRTVTGVGAWTPHGRSSAGFPKVKILNAPSGSTNILRYRYRRKNVNISEFPENFKFVLIGAIVKRLIPAFDVVYQRDLETMIDHYAMSGGEDMPAALDPVLIARNNERSRLFGWGG